MILRRQQMYAPGMGGGAKASRDPQLGFVLIDRTAGSAIGDMVNGGNLAAAFDGVTDQAFAATANKGANTSAYIGRTLAAAKVFARAVVYGSNDSGFLSTNGELTLTIYGKTGAAPANATDGTALGSVVFTDTGNESAGRQIESTDLVSTWDHLWVHYSMASASSRCAELVLYEWA